MSIIMKGKLKAKAVIEKVTWNGDAMRGYFQKHMSKIENRKAAEERSRSRS